MMLLMNCGQVDSSTFIVTPESWLLTCKLTLLWTIFWRKQVSGEPLLCAVWWTSAETHSSTHSSAWGWSAGAGTAVQYILNIFSRKPCSCRGPIGLKCPGSWWMEWGKKMCADSAIGCHQIHNQNTERDTIQWKHSAAPSSFKMGNLESTTTPTAAQLRGITKWLPPLHCKPLHSQHSTIQTTQINSILRSWNISESFQSIIMELVIRGNTSDSSYNRASPGAPPLLYSPIPEFYVCFCSTLCPRSGRPGEGFREWIL